MRREIKTEDPSCTHCQSWRNKMQPLSWGTLLLLVGSYVLGMLLLVFFIHQGAHHPWANAATMITVCLFILASITFFDKLIRIPITLFGRTLYAYMDTYDRLHLHQQDPRLLIHHSTTESVIWIQYLSRQRWFQIKHGGFGRSRVIAKDFNQSDWRLTFRRNNLNDPILDDATGNRIQWRVQWDLRLALEFVNAFPTVEACLHERDELAELCDYFGGGFFLMLRILQSGRGKMGNSKHAQLWREMAEYWLQIGQKEQTGPNLLRDNELRGHWLKLAEEKLAVWIQRMEELSRPKTEAPPDEPPQTSPDA